MKLKRILFKQNPHLLGSTLFFLLFRTYPFYGDT